MRSSITLRLAPWPKYLYPVVMNFSWAHWHENGNGHGPRIRHANGRVEFTVKSWSWLYCATDSALPTTGHRLWIYGWRGRALCADLTIDRRPYVPPQGVCRKCGQALPQ